MSKKSAYRRRKELSHTVAFTSRTWDYIRVHLGWPETGEPVPYAVCLEFRDRLRGKREASELLTLVALVTEGWRQSYPQPPQAATLYV